MPRFGGVRAALLVLLLPPPGSLSAQAVLRGKLLAQEDRLPVAAAEVALLDSTGNAAVRTSSDSLGRFTLSAVAGRYRLRVARLAIATTISDTLTLTAGENTVVELLLPADPVALPALSVVHRVQSEPAMLRDFALRRGRGKGVFLTRADLQPRKGIRLSEVLAAAAGLDVVRVPRSGVRTLRLRRAAGNTPCPVQLYVDGRRYLGGDAADLDIFDVADIDGVEIYRGLAEVPADFGGPEARCGVVALWTHRPAADSTEAPEPAGHALGLRFLVVAGLAALVVVLTR